MLIEIKIKVNDADFLKKIIGVGVSCLWLFFFLSIQTSAIERRTAVKTQKKLQGAVEDNYWITELERLGIHSALEPVVHSSNFNVRVTELQLGTPAYTSGINVGDYVVKTSKSGNNYAITIQRAGRIYQVHLARIAKDSQKKTLPSDLRASKASSSTVLEEQQDKEKTLAQYKIEFLIDTSSSMKLVDGTGELSKFQWCGENVHLFADAMAKFNREITITTFNDTFVTRSNCNTNDLAQIFATTQPRGQTNLLDPLMARLENGIVSSDSPPLLMVILHDGEPNVPSDPYAVARAVISFSRKLTSGKQAHIILIQIGDSEYGGDFCRALDEDLVGMGAKFDIVSTKSFRELKSSGLVSAIWDALFSNQHNSSKIERALKRLPPSSGVNNAQKMLLDSNIERASNERKTLENSLR